MRRWTQRIVVAALVAQAPARAGAAPPVRPPEVTLAFSVGGALLAPAAAEPAARGIPLGVALGSRFPNGLAVSLRYDNLELHPDGGDGTPWQLLSLALRFTAVDRRPEPFAEMAAGLSLVSGDLPLGPGAGPLDHGFGMSLGGGIAIPLGAQLELELAARGFLSPAFDRTLLAASLDVGLELAIAGP